MKCPDCGEFIEIKPVRLERVIPGAIEGEAAPIPVNNPIGIRGKEIGKG